VCCISVGGVAEVPGAAEMAGVGGEGGYGGEGGGWSCLMEQGLWERGLPG
jgi:hypothetical protein